jgi:acetyl-CoA carboxylase, biotin carboxylase subunit
MQNKILIANRGEIAIRIMRATKELGIPHVVVYSTADKDSLHVKLADEAICIGGPKSHESYLDYEPSSKRSDCLTGCNAIHPGYGFLSENSAFVEMVEQCNIHLSDQIQNDCA